ncbi:MAG: cryptochrome/photolyase family protein [Solirubrobacterales bacterium]|nr:cryptochrome/photolyase family protein [Solirubrobacterales bacterium]
MGHTLLILGDQLLREHPGLDGANRVITVESEAMLRRRPLHRQRAHLVRSGLRHLAAELRERDGLEVIEHRGAATLAEALAQHDGEELVAAIPNDLGARRALEGHGVRLVDSGQFLTAPDDFAAWARGRRRLRMEDFYREQRRSFGVLVDDAGEPLGGRWNFDAENRQPPPKDGLNAPEAWSPREDEIDAEVRADLDAAAARGVVFFGADVPRRFAVTPAEAHAVLEDFVAHRLREFGPWQDAMVEPGNPFLFHSLLSVPLNLGVIDPLTCVRAAEEAYHAHDLPLSSVEGFVRQVIGWREYVWGMYWLRAEQWPDANALRAELPLPAAYRGVESGWNCLDTVVAGVAQHGYAHHIERLMVLGTIGLTAGVVPWELVRWFQTAFVDGAEWVMAPNAAGMALFADGGEMVTKPYAAGGNYISKMSPHCKSCQYKPSEKHGERACPVTALYWDFVDRHTERLAANNRTARSVSTWRRFDQDTRDAVRARAASAREELDGG